MAKLDVFWHHNQSAGCIVMELREDVVPKTAENFLALCTREKGFGKKGSGFHSFIPGSYQSDDFMNHNRTGGMSIYGNKFADENFSLKHTWAGIQILHSSSFKSFICTAKTSWLDGKHVVFGSMVEGRCQGYWKQKTDFGKMLPHLSLYIWEVGKCVSNFISCACVEFSSL